MSDGSQPALFSSARIGSFNPSDRVMVTWMRLALATSILTSVLLTPQVTPQAAAIFSPLSIYLICVGYLVLGAALCAFAPRSLTHAHDRLLHWVDAAWVSLIVIATGGAESFYFSAFFFPILTASLRWGFNLGGRITIASAVALGVSHLLEGGTAELPILLMRTAFLLALGHMSAYWGESNLTLKRRLALLRDVSQLSNPRFGMDQTITATLASIRTFFEAGSCILVMREPDPLRYTLRCVSGNGMPGPVSAQPIGAAFGERLLISASGMVVYVSHWWQRGQRGQHGHQGHVQIGDLAGDNWESPRSASSLRLAELLDARFHISTPLRLHGGDGRLYVLSDQRCYGKADAAFLSDAVAQAFRMIENVDLVDRMASEAAHQEREKLALDLHDTALQPYIGLSMGLAAICRKATSDNPLGGDLARLHSMTTNTIGELRRYASAVKSRTNDQREPLFSLLLRRQAEQVQRLYGLSIEIDLQHGLSVSDRLSAQLLQFVIEGLNNICKHTVAQKGLVRIRILDGSILVEIENDAGFDDSISFTPASISARAAALGGNVRVMQGGRKQTVVAIRIPV